MRIIYSIFTFCCVATLGLFAQDVPSPGAEQSERIVLTGATIHVGNGEVIENGVIVMEDGKISKCHDAKVKVAYPDEQVMDISGKHVYPGLITPNSVLGLVEISAVRATRDNREVGYMNPHVRSLIAYNTDSRVTPTVRSNGVLTAQVKPEGGRISGSSSVVYLDAWNWEDAQVRADDGIFVNWPAIYRQTGWWAEPGPIKPNEDYEKQVHELISFVAEAAASCKGGSGTKNLKMEAMCGIFSGEQNFYVQASQSKQIIDAVKMAEDYGVNLVIVGGRDSWLLTDLLKEHDVPVILQKMNKLPGMIDDDIDISYKLPSILQEAGILFCISAENSSGEQRNLPFNAGKAVAYGLDKEEALAAVSLNAAKILGVDDRIGSLEEGKDATLVISDGDILDIRGNQIDLAFVEGRALDLGNRHKDLYKKFMAKYDFKVKRN